MITITLTPTTPEQLDSVLSLLVQLRLDDMPVKHAPAVEQPEAEQPKTVRRTRKNPPAEPVVEQPVAEQAEPVAVAPEPEQPAPAYTLEQVRVRLAELSQAGKKAEVLAALGLFGATRLTEIRPDRFGDLMSAVEHL